MNAKFDQSMMFRALALARRGGRAVAPNPLVGAVVVKQREIVGAGWHKQSGGDHAEIEALRQAGSNARGGTLYVTLEPCNHFGKTPPCVQRIIEAGISRVVYAMSDPNPNVAGGGASALASHGIDTQSGVLAREALRINDGWVSWVLTGRPRVTVKLALTQDNCVSLRSGSRSQLSNRLSNAFVHRLRGRNDAIIVGSRTVEIDNPRLSNRSGVGAQPSRVVLDRCLTTSPESAVFQDTKCNPTLVFCGLEQFSSGKVGALLRRGVQVQAVAESDGGLDLREILSILGVGGVQNLLCEGGARLATEFVKQRLVDDLLICRCPRTAGSSGVRFNLEDLLGTYLLDAPECRWSIGEDRWSRFVPIQTDKVNDV